ncbi:MAG: DUF2062 domain-containing protein [Rhizobiaceae bacterium]|nr:DUF2062 domain-containing protein [Rhizobiaceae bacterium]
MLFRRKKPAHWHETLRISLWPRRSWARSAAYVTKRILRLTGSPHAISAGVAAGVFASFTPFMGFHFLTAFLVAYIIAGNLLAAALGTFFGNPISFPFIWASTYTTGNFILNRSSSHTQGGLGETLKSLGGNWDQGISSIFSHIVGIWNPVIKPMLVGSIPVGVSVSVAVYIVTRWLAIKFRDRRNRRLKMKAAKIEEQKLIHARELVTPDIEPDSDQ